MMTLVRFGLFLSALVCITLPSFGQTEPQPRYVGSSSCATCHAAEATAWQNSHHSKAWMPANKETVDGNFEGAEFTHKGRTSRFFQNDDGFFVETTDTPNAPKTFKVVGVGGIAPLQQYLLETEPGRLQSFDVVWDQEQETWYHLYPEQELPPGDGFHWSGPYKNWNARCAECHSTGFEKNYSLRNRNFHSTQAEIGVGCEACHGPGEAHISWSTGSFSESELFAPDFSDKGFSLEFSKKLPDLEVQQCAGCHSRREPFQDFSPIPGTPFHDSYGLARLREGLYHPDGQILDEVYVYGSFLQSKMHEKGVRCSNCHDPHSAKLLAKGNAVCTQCHSLAVNGDFPTLASKQYDDPSHHFHRPGTEGAQCVSCHMIERTYMGIDGRRDHSFRIPRPDVSARIGTPNACIDCHQDKTAEWAAAELENRFPDSNHRQRHFGETFFEVRNGTKEVGEDLLAIAMQDTFPPIVRATAIDLLARQMNADLAIQASSLLDDPEPLIRVAAVNLQNFLTGPERVNRILLALEDPIKAVRIAAARQLIGIRQSQIPAHSTDAVKSATKEWQSSLAAKSDFPETHMAIGGAALAMRNPAAAIAAFTEVTALDPQLVEAWVYLVRLHWSQGNNAATELTLQKALSLNPDDPNLLELGRQFLAR